MSLFLTKLVYSSNNSYNSQDEEDEEDDEEDGSSIEEEEHDRVHNDDHEHEHEDVDEDDVAAGANTEDAPAYTNLGAPVEVGPNGYAVSPIHLSSGSPANYQVEKKEKPEEDEPEAHAADAAASDAVGDDAASERDLSRREQKAPAREQPTTGEGISHSESGVGSLDETPDLGEVPHAPTPANETPSSGGMFSRFTETLKK